MRKAASRHVLHKHKLAYGDVTILVTSNSKHPAMKAAAKGRKHAVDAASGWMEEDMKRRTILWLKSLVIMGLWGPAAIPSAVAEVKWCEILDKGAPNCREPDAMSVETFAGKLRIQIIHGNRSRTEIIPTQQG
jgi:hypothetical protein